MPNVCDLHVNLHVPQKIVGCPLPPLEAIARSLCLRKTLAITGDPLHPAHNLFDLLTCGWRLRLIRSHTSRLTHSFFPWATRTPTHTLPTMSQCVSDPHHSGHSHTGWLWLCSPLWAFLLFLYIFLLLFIPVVYFYILFLHSVLQRLDGSSGSDRESLWTVTQAKLLWRHQPGL